MKTPEESAEAGAERCGRGPNIAGVLGTKVAISTLKGAVMPRVLSLRHDRRPHSPSPMRSVKPLPGRSRHLCDSGRRRRATFVNTPARLSRRRCTPAVTRRTSSTGFAHAASLGATDRIGIVGQAIARSNPKTIADLTPLWRGSRNLAAPTSNTSPARCSTRATAFSSAGC